MASVKVNFVQFKMPTKVFFNSTISAPCRQYMLLRGNNLKWPKVTVQVVLLPPAYAAEVMFSSSLCVSVSVRAITFE